MIQTIRIDPTATASTGPVPIPRWMYATRHARRWLARRGPRRGRKARMQGLLHLRFGAILSTTRISDSAKKVTLVP